MNVNASESVRFILEEGSKVKCEDSEDFNQNDIYQLPEWYDHEKFKRGQKFFHDHIWGLMLSKLCGLMVILSEKSILDILIHTKKSDTAHSAFKRYIQTVFHMYIWYHKDFQPGSKLWKSILEVRNKHNMASKSASKCGIGKITQKDMAITQFGFMGFACVKPRMVGLYGIDEKDWEGFFHLWRVVGHILGVEDRFNLCSGTNEEIRKKCQEIVNQVLRPNLEIFPKNFENMVKALVDGLWSFNPGIEYEAFLIYILKMCDKNNEKVDKNGTKIHLVEPKKGTDFTLKLLNFILYFYRYWIFRTFMNYVQYSSFWLIENFPFLAYYQFGFKGSHVRILK